MGCFMKVEPIIFSIILDLKDERKRGVKDNFKIKLDFSFLKGKYLLQFPKSPGEGWPAQQAFHQEGNNQDQA